MQGKVNVIVLRVEGTNCDRETVEAFERVKANTDLVHVNEIKKGHKDLETYQILAVPGGFSYGDDVSAGILLANQLKYEIGDALKSFVESEKLVIGICNGFQALVRLGLLPGFNSKKVLNPRQESTLAVNDVGIFVDRWVRLKLENRGTCIFTKNQKNSIFLPVAHAEGKFVTSTENLQLLESQDQIVFKYIDPDGNYAGYPWNPNGSMENIAGICSHSGLILGMMPHPERYLHKYMHPYWTRLPKLPEEGDGLQIFQNAVEYAAKKL
jgi:phosphoribosylformylglycinamidine synthase